MFISAVPFSVVASRDLLSIELTVFYKLIYISDENESLTLAIYKRTLIELN